MNVHLRSVGCRLNQSEIETLSRSVLTRGGHLTADAAQADTIILNTCAVTADAARTSRRLTRQMHQAAPGAQIFVTGCQAELRPGDFALPGVAGVVGNRDKDDLLNVIPGLSDEPYEREPIMRNAPVWLGRTRAFVKAQDGCDNACTFCVTTVARGEGRSRPLDALIDEVRALTAAGYLEIVLTGVHLGSYGADLEPKITLQALVAALLRDTDVRRLRLSSLEPWDLDEAFFRLWEDMRLCPHLHLPLQSGCDRTLRRMARRTNQRAFAALVQAARDIMPDACITTDVIAGFPGEDDAEFAESLAFVQAMAFADLHVFRYSPRSGTAAARMTRQVSDADKKARSAALLAHAADQRAAYAARWVGREAPVLWEQVAGASEQGFINAGYTPHYVRVNWTGPDVLTGRETLARLEQWDQQRQVMTAALN